MARKTIGLDCDGILFDFVGAACEWSGFKREDATDFDIFKAWGAPGLWKAFDEYAQRPGFCLNLPLISCAQNFVWQLGHLGDVVFVTSPYRNAPTWAYEREQAILRSFGYDRDRIVSARSKQYARVDVLIDDKPSNVETFPGTAILFEQPWNRDCESGLHAHGYAEVIKLVKGILP